MSPATPLSYMCVFSVLIASLLHPCCPNPCWRCLLPPPWPPLGLTIPSSASPSPPPKKKVCQEAASLCETLSAAQDAALDMAPELTRAVTNVVCSLCFNSSYRRGDPEFEAMLEYSQGIVDTVAKESLVDIFPWLQVSGDTGAAWSSPEGGEEGAGG